MKPQGQHGTGADDIQRKDNIFPPTPPLGKKGRKTFRLAKKSANRHLPNKPRSCQPPVARKSRPKRKPNKFACYRLRKKSLKRLRFRSYKTYLNSKLWKRLRREVLKANPACIACHGKATQVHHSLYDVITLSGKSKKCLHSVCADCHTEAEFENGKKASVEQANRNLGITQVGGQIQK